MKVGAERNKIIVLSVLGVVGAYVFYDNVLSTPGSTAPKSPAAARIMSTPNTAGAPAAGPAAPDIRRARVPVRGGSNDFHPKFLQRAEERPNLATIDPKLQLDLLAKVRAVERTGGERNLFQFGSAPPPPAPKEPPVKVGVIMPLTPAQIAQAKEAELAKSAEPVKAPPPNIPLRYYGYATPKTTGAKRAFFMEGEDIYVAAEGEIIKKRYKLIRIGLTSVTMEDMDTKNQQTLIILKEQQAG